MLSRFFRWFTYPIFLYIHFYLLFLFNLHVLSIFLSFFIFLIINCYFSFLKVYLYIFLTLFYLHYISLYLFYSCCIYLTFNLLFLFFLVVLRIEPRTLSTSGRHSATELQIGTGPCSSHDVVLLKHSWVFEIKEIGHKRPLLVTSPQKDTYRKESDT
jgi:hypothetical protein